MRDTGPLLMATDFPSINRLPTEILQINLGYLCNLSCTHCHVNAGPTRTELMDKKTIETVLNFIDTQGIRTLDLTGGAPEMNPLFRYLVTEARKRDVQVIDRCNLTILLEPGYEDLIGFLADNQVEIVASLPCYTAENVDKQRGKGVFDGSVKALLALNAVGYGKGNPDLKLSLVYNPGGAFLPPPQAALKKDYQRELAEYFDIQFDDLFTITNMPISRFGAVLLSKGEFEPYMDLLKSAYVKDNLKSVMCRTTLSIDWEGYVYDCDFNQMLEMPITIERTHAIATDNPKVHLSELVSKNLQGVAISVADHCYGCTAGQGSSCGGAL